MATSRRLVAILAADVVGYSRLMEADEEGTLAALKAIRRELGDPRSRSTTAVLSRPPVRMRRLTIARRRFVTVTGVGSKGGMG